MWSVEYSEENLTTLGKLEIGDVFEFIEVGHSLGGAYCVMVMNRSRPDSNYSQQIFLSYKNGKVESHDFASSCAKVRKRKANVVIKIKD